MNTAVFSINTGRCGTHWITNVINTHYSDKYKANHEGLSANYLPNIYYRIDNPYAQLNKPEIRTHINNIRKILNTTNYIEPGYTSYSMLPVFIEQLSDQNEIKMIHIIRHPVDWVVSALTQGFYNSENIIQKTTLLNPQHNLIYADKYRSKWNDFIPAEKLAWHWLELNTYAEELKEKYSVEWLTIRMEDLFKDSYTLTSLLSFLGLPNSPEVSKLTNKTIAGRDRVCSQKQREVDLSTILFPEILDLIDKYNYNIDLEGPKSFPLNCSIDPQLVP